jgi:hypothetical protein
MAIIKKSKVMSARIPCTWREYKLIQPLWKTAWMFLKKLKVKLPYNPAIHCWVYIQMKWNQ